MEVIKILICTTVLSVLNDGNITEWFRVEIGLRQGCAFIINAIQHILLEFAMNDGYLVPSPRCGFRFEAVSRL